jgi:chromosome segregation ATPase
VNRDREQRLERLREVRDVQEHVARSTWAAAEDRAAAVRQRVSSLEDTLTRARAELDELLRQRALAEAEHAVYERPLEVMAGHLAVARAECAEREAQAERERDSWAATQRDAKAATELEARARGERRREEQRREEVEAQEQETARRRDLAAGPMLGAEGP